jgi:hypothetical protein
LLVVLAVGGISAIYERFGPTVATVVASLRSSHLSRLDNAQMERGYYESLLHVDRFNSQLWEVYMKHPKNWLDFETGPMKQYTGGFDIYELKPSFVYANKGVTITINRWGMRDKDYARIPPPGTYRVALLGPSSVMGWGVQDDETFEAKLEDSLNRDPAPAFAGRHFEMLNFGVPGYDPPQQLVMLDKALAFQPDAVIYVGTGRELSRATRYVADAARTGLDIPYDFLRKAVTETGIENGMDETTAIKRLVPRRTAILSGIYDHLVADARRHNAIPVYVFLPQVTEGDWEEETPETLRLAAAAGFDVIDLSSIYRGQDIATIRGDEYDGNPKRKGHPLVADRLYDLLRAGQLFAPRPVR